MPLRFILMFGVALLAIRCSSESRPRVVRAVVDGAINPATAEYLHGAIAHARETRSECLIIELNTPGGLLRSTRAIVSDFLSSPVPIVVYVSPSGSQAASAGVFLTLAAHVAVMAPGTNIGAAHPVSGGEPMDSIMMQKVTNDAAAFIRSISEQRNRNVRWAEEAVRKSVSITESEALANHVIDTIAADLDGVLGFVNERRIYNGPDAVRITTQDATIEEFEISFRQKLLNILSDPNIAYILMMLGIYGLLFELYNPGALFPGIIGAISLILAFYSLATLPVNYAGAALILLAVIMLVLEIKIVSHGLLTVGGVISLLLGSLMLIEAESPLDLVSISWQVILAVTVMTLAFFGLAIGMGLRAQKRKPTTGMQGMIGERGVAASDLNPEGQVVVHGEIWTAISESGLISRGSEIVVAGSENLRLRVRTYTA
jgi:membrane-bound serine protease (ClpP class)